VPVIIRPERVTDFNAIDAVVAAAFESDVEAKLVRDVREDSCYRPELALVAVRDDRVVGHVMISDATLVEGETTHRIAMLSPLAVSPERQKDGIGAALVRSVTNLADELGEQIVILEGSPMYYPRFGFVDARTLDISIDLPNWAPANAGQALPLAAYDRSLRGKVVYPPPFNGLE
jgi:putative acetyltransferase